MKPCKIGLLPLYLKLYDDTCPHMRPRIDAFLAQITGLLEDRGLSLVRAPVCRVRAEFEAAADLFLTEDVCAVVTLHLAYSPSLEAADALGRVDAPIIALDTTPAAAFGPETDPEEILYNHGIHGVQDLCNLLLRRGRQFFVEAGHYADSDVLDRAAALCRAAAAARAFRQARVGLVGDPFPGMGDFQVPFEQLKSELGITVAPLCPADVPRFYAAVTPGEVRAEIDRDLADCEIGIYNEKAHEDTVRASLLLRKWIAAEGLDAFSLNFLAATPDAGFACVPFPEAGKQMAAGVGYAGEGDVLTAALVGALLRLEPRSSFTEMFCPDWRGNSILLSHMGEINPAVAAGRLRLTEKDFPYTDAGNPMAAYGRYAPGPGVLCNLAPLGGGKYRLILSAVEVLDAPGEDKCSADVPNTSALRDSIHGWFRPAGSVADFLRRYSETGGTHHLALSYTENLTPFAALGRMLGFDVVIL